ncbi:MAG: PSD1 and planctomycete cytochrome C domain-containing protein [Planctomycetota bacterium]|jgi:hypothetical protein
MSLMLSNLLVDQRGTLILIAAFATVVQSSMLRGEDSEIAPEAARFFENRIRPVLVQHCYKCHSASSGKSEGSLLVDSRDGLRTGGDRGPAVVPGKPEESLLLQAMTHADPDLRMPPKRERLPDTVLRDFAAWIQNGAIDPRTESPADAPRPPVDYETGRQFWSFQTPARHDVPDVQNNDWPVSDVDRFVLARLEADGLTPSLNAKPATLLRRLYFDLTGLPPSPSERSRFLQAVRSNGLDAALKAEVDRLLSSHHFGERWGRHWLDVARFAESSGKEANISFPYAWRYRDYVIDCINNDLPYDRFLTEQLAGDLLPYDSPQERARLLIATGFLAIGAKNLDEANGFQFLADVIDEQIDTVSRAVMANSVACARCHDHKFDPFTMRDYYALAGVFVSTETFFGTAVSPANRVSGDPLLLPLDASQPILHKGIPAARVRKLKDQLATLKKEEADGRAAVRKAIAEGRDPEGIFTLRDALRIFWRSGAIEGQLEKVSDVGKPLPLAMGVLDRDQILDAPLLDRGDIRKAGDKVPRAFPGVIELDCDSPSTEQSGRLQFARWLTHPDHPLTARVMVNRVWHHLFGAGIVQTVDNFGMTGKPPSHPELLDNLAVQFVDDGWSIKSLVRSLVLTRTYRQASTFKESAFKHDPDNRLLWRMPKRRLDAESIRDAMLVASGDLDPARPVGSLVGRVIGDRPISLIGLDQRIPADLDGTTHRSVYLPVLRDRLPDVLDLFDFAEPSLVTGARGTTNVPVQALYLMNSPFVRERSESLARRIQSESTGRDGQIRLAFLLCFNREPDGDELQTARDFLDDVSGQTEEAITKQLASFCQSLMATAEFRHID